ncbi:hypothetical protein [Candidatus Enterococcus ferrettii]|uniref:Accessory Sec system protein Asp3 n=1 Tax=Candidatus Enterococcus ferrettii TaxID=2815324 RepID=A0ABV0EW19_9ENTE|nr:hypothetical protein [Enterococcus sp. 665A]MBO1342795.1 hypothetical protein [Enterococcus sp. 665A]
MEYELVSIIKPANSIWEKQKKRLKAHGGKVISISPSPTFNKLIFKEEVQGINLLDSLTQREHHKDNFLFFNQIPTVYSAEIFMNEDRSISIVNDGEEIGRVDLYPETRRHVKEVQYLNADGSTDFIEEYADDGGLYSNLFFFNNTVQEIDFFNSRQLPIVSYFFYEGKINLVVVRDPETMRVTAKYNSLLEFVTDQVAQLVTEKDQISISYMGMEMFALEKTTSHNILYLEESPFDNKGVIKGNLLNILKDNISYINEVRMANIYYKQLKDRNVPLDKAAILDEGEAVYDSNNSSR